MRPAIEKTLPNIESYWYFFELSNTQASEKDDFDFLPQATQFKEVDTPMEYKNLTKYSESCRPRICTEFVQS